MNHMKPEPEVYLSWDDDGVRLMCERKECMTDGGRWWWTRHLEYKATPEDAAAARDEHVATHR